MENFEIKPVHAIGSVKLSNEMIEELAELQAKNNSALNADIKQLDEVIDFLLCIHNHREDAISSETLLDCITSLRWIISRYEIFKAPDIVSNKT